MLSTCKRQTSSSSLQAQRSAQELQDLCSRSWICLVLAPSADSSPVKCQLELVPFQELHKWPWRTSTLPLGCRGRKLHFLISTSLQRGASPGEVC